MYRRKLQIIVLPLAIAAAGPAAAQTQMTSNPIPAPIEKRGLAVEIVEITRLPDTCGVRPADQDVKPAGWARMNCVRDLIVTEWRATNPAASGNRVDVSLQELIDRKMGAKISRADLFISLTRDGELLITSRQDGTIRMLVPNSAASRK